MKEWIKVGDTVSVEMNGSEWMIPTAEVLYKPQATGDSWVFRTQGGDIVYISEGCTITKPRGSNQ